METAVPSPSQCYPPAPFLVRPERFNSSFPYSTSFELDDPPSGYDNVKISDVRSQEEGGISTVSDIPNGYVWFQVSGKIQKPSLTGNKDDSEDSATSAAAQGQSSLTASVFLPSTSSLYTSCFSSNYVESVTDKCGNRKSLRTMCKMLGHRAGGGEGVRVWTTDEIKVGGASDDAASTVRDGDANSSDDRPEFMWLVIELKSEFDSCLYPFKLSPAPTSPDAGETTQLARARSEISRLRGVVRSLEGREVSPACSPAKPPLRQGGLGSPRRSDYNALLSKHKSLKAAYTDLLNVHEKETRKYQRSLRGLAYSQANGSRGGGVGKHSRAQNAMEINKLKGRVEGMEREKVKEDRKREREKENWLKVKGKLEREVKALRGRVRELKGGGGGFEARKMGSMSPGGMSTGSLSSLGSTGSLRSARSERSERSDVTGGSWRTKESGGRGRSKKSEGHPASSRRPASSSRSRPASSSRPRPASSSRPRPASSSRPRPASSSRPRPASSPRTRPSSSGRTAASGGKRFDPTQYVRDKEEKLKRTRSNSPSGRSVSSQGSSSIGFHRPPSVKRVNRRGEKSPRRGSKENRHSSTVKQKSPRKASQYNIDTGTVPVQDEGVMRDINEIDRRLNALQGFLKEAKSPKKGRGR
ncbi:hypothetical protein TrCOL_g12637 [Triparma columacea]|uniref:Uncharacterized protein n=1 Tax=Triparma columacea TaxID=722753 RepID=A0A9W7L4M6_9STRA|nr:hypothetical protein TrCOL_g12637 [Triparma columacea]